MALPFSLVVPFFSCPKRLQAGQAEAGGSSGSPSSLEAVAKSATLRLGGLVAQDAARVAPSFPGWKMNTKEQTRRPALC